jgi:hypothetical protein
VKAAPGGCAFSWSDGKRIFARPEFVQVAPDESALLLIQELLAQVLLGLEACSA